MSTYTNKGVYTLELEIHDSEGKVLEEQTMATNAIESIISRLETVAERLKELV